MAYTITDDCVKCGLCAMECPAKAISETDTKYVVNPTLCNNSGKCAEVCPVGAAKSS